jgi:hypothetical protein
MFGLSDAECFLLGWAVVATVMYFRAKAEAELARKMFMHFVKDAKAREGIVDAWEKFKKARGA